MTPKGRPTRSRDRLRNSFLTALADDFGRHGIAAIEEMRTKDPSGYVRVIASLMPKDMNITHQANPLEQLTDEQLAAVVNATERFLATGAGDAGAEAPAEPEEPSALH